MLGNDTVERIKEGVDARAAVDPHYYRFWWYGMDPLDVGRMARPWFGNWDNCTSLFNGILGEMGDEGYPLGPIGGTGMWNGVVGTNSSRAYEEPLLDKNYPPGSFGVTPYASDATQGHLQMVYDAARRAGRQSWGHQYMAQSDTTRGISADGNWADPGTNVDYSMSWSFNFIDWPTWIGLIPGVPAIDGFPGYRTSARGVVKWYIDVCEWWYDMPPIIPLVCIGTELGPVLDDERRTSIWDIPGYASSLDHDSYGQHQQRWMYYPWPWDFETAAWSFMAAVDRELGDAPYPDEDDADGVCELIQRVQVSAYPDAYREDYDWVKELLTSVRREQGGPIVVDPVPKPKPEPENPFGDAWIGHTGDEEQWMRSGPPYGMPRGTWYRPTYSGGKWWLEVVPPGNEGSEGAEGNEEGNEDGQDDTE